MSLNRNKENSGRRRTAHSKDDIELVRNIRKEPKFLHKCLLKQLFCKYEANLQENTHAEV